MILNGKETALHLNVELKVRIQEDLKTQRAPHLAIILIGSHPASLSYIKGKLSAAKLVGIQATLHQFDDNVSHELVLNQIKKLNQDHEVDGMILQLPLPKHLDEVMLTQAIDVSKDADGFHVLNQGLLYQGKPSVKPATPYGITLLLKAYGIDVLGKHAVIIGRSNIVGFPIARLLMDLGATITVCHSKTKDLSYYTKQADILIVSVGKPHLINKNMIKKDVVILDVGINKVDDKLVGDVDFDDVYHSVSAITPVPGGIGPMTIHALLLNTYHLYEKNVKINHK
jgi:methylenetetrahydrofolate dehydrogenase (NADP+)/methenyltetrahydrofolate cyclohydrolase